MFRLVSPHPSLNSVFNIITLPALSLPTPLLFLQLLVFGNAVNETYVLVTYLLKDPLLLLVISYCWALERLS